MLTRDDIIRMAREVGIEFALAPMAMVTQSELQRFAEIVAAKETEARKAVQLETIELREELTKRAMQAEKEAYQRGVRDEREACASLCNKYAELMINGRDGCAPITIAMIDQIVKSSNELAHLIRLRNNQGNQQ